MLPQEKGEADSGAEDNRSSVRETLTSRGIANAI